MIHYKKVITVVCISLLFQPELDEINEHEKHDEVLSDTAVPTANVPADVKKNKKKTTPKSVSSKICVIFDAKSHVKTNEPSQCMR